MSLQPLERNLFLFEGLSEDERDAILSDARLYTRVYSTGEQIYDSAVFAPCLGMVLSGAVRIERNAEGKTVPMGVIGRGGVFGAASMFGGNAYVTVILAKSRTKVLFFSQELIADLIRRYPQVAYNYIVFLSEKLRYLNARIDVYTAGGAREKLYEYLLALSDAHGCVRLGCSMSSLAGQLDIGRASLYRAFSALISEGRIERDGECYRIVK